MYSQKDNEFYKNINTKKDLNYNVYNVNIANEFQIIYSSLHLERYMYDEDTTILGHLSHFYTDEKLKEAVNKARKVDDIISDNYFQTLYDICRDNYPYLNIFERSPFELEELNTEEITPSSTDKILYSLLKLKSMPINDITQADKFFAIDSRFYTQYLTKFLNYKNSYMEVNTLLDLSNKVYSNLKEQLHDDDSINKFLIKNRVKVIDSLKSMLEKHVQNIDITFPPTMIEKHIKSIDYSKEINVKSINYVSPEELNKINKDKEIKKQFDKNYQIILNDIKDKSINPIAKEIYAALKLNTIINYKNLTGTVFFSNYKQHMLMNLTGHIWYKCAMKHNFTDNYIEDDLNKNKLQILKAIDLCVKDYKKTNSLDNIDTYLNPVLQKETVDKNINSSKKESQIEEHIKNSIGKYSDRKIINDILKNSSNFKELKNKSSILQKKIVSNAIKQINKIVNRLGR